MEPSNMYSWRENTFVAKAKITFSVNTALACLIPQSEMFAAVVLADRQEPWIHNGQAAQLNISQAEVSSDDDKVILYSVPFQSACALIPSQLSAYVKYMAQLAKNAHQFITSGAINWIGSTVDFEGASIIFDRPELLVHD